MHLPQGWGGVGLKLERQAHTHSHTQANELSGHGLPRLEGQSGPNVSTFTQNVECLNRSSSSLVNTVSISCNPVWRSEVVP